MEPQESEGEHPSKAFVAGVECTEEEPDDDFLRPAIRVTAVNESGDSKQQTVLDQPTAGDVEPTPADVEPTAADVEPTAADVEPQETIQEESGVLEGHWQQLEGTSVRFRRGQRSGELPRFLFWGAHGHVAVFPEDRRIEVQLPGENAPRRVGDFIGLEMASLSGDTCCLAAGADAEGGSRLLIRPHERWDKPVFTAALGGVGEAVEAVACGDGFVAALTSKRLLRVYSTSSVPLGVVSMPGRSVALAARGPLLLAVTEAVTQRGCVDGEDIALDYRLLDVRNRSQRSAGHLPLSFGARLRWLGLSTDLAPVAVDTFGQVRMLLGTGAGSWGPVGGGAEWVPMLSLAEEEVRSGPLWVVHADRGALYCAELGNEATTPKPRRPTPASIGEAPAEADVLPDGDGPCYGHGFKLREFRWRLPVGPVPGVGGAVEESLREQLFAHHAGVTASAGMLPSGEATAAALAQSKAWKSKAFALFGQLVKAGELERSLDVARSFLASGEGGSRLLTFAQDFAEKAGHYKLADEVAKVPRIHTGSSLPQAHIGDSSLPTIPAAAPSAAVPPTISAPAASPAQAVPKVLRRELPPLFEPGEVGEATPSASMDKALTMLSKSSESQPLSAAPVALLESPPASIEPAPKVDVAAGLEQPHVISSPAPQAAEVQRPSSNPFARKRAATGASTPTPHLLRDALGGGTRKAAPPATPLGLGSAASIEPAMKVAKT